MPSRKPGDLKTVLPANEPRSLPPTSWSLLAAANAANPERAAPAMEEFARRYRGPVLAYLSALSGDVEGAGDLTQAFFASRVLSGRLLGCVARSKGSFRPYLKRAVKNFYVDEVRKQARRVRRGETSMSLDGERERSVTAPKDSQPDAVYHAAWIRTLLTKALARVHERCASLDQMDHYDLFVWRYLSEDSDPPSWVELGKRFGLDEKAARGRAETVARHFRIVLRQMMVVETGSRKGADEEIATLLALL